MQGHRFSWNILYLRGYLLGDSSKENASAADGFLNILANQDLASINLSVKLIGHTAIRERGKECARQTQEGWLLVSMKLTDDEVSELQSRYSYLTNYQAGDLDAPIDPLTYVDSNGDGLLHIAAQLGDARTVELLLHAGVDVNQLGDMGCTALHYASMSHKEDVIRLLLLNNAATDIVNDFGKLAEES